MEKLCRRGHGARSGKRRFALLMSLCLIGTMIPAMPGGAVEVQAATESGTGNTPSVSAYATKEQMMDGTFAPNADGTAVNYGKLVFGKNGSGASQQWYILGKDDRVSGDNTIIFAASPIATGKKFEDDWTNNKTESSLWSDCDYNGVSITEVFPNHYGASDLRVALQDMATDTKYFTAAEQGLMNDTTVKTKDTSNGNVTYTTTDKLYALAADGNGSSYKTIKAGSSDSTVLAMSSYWSSGDWFWLRSPYNGSNLYALLARPGFYVSLGDIKYGYAVQPASNLNLSSVLFASAATAASSDTAVAETIANGTAMTLRLNGTGKNIGTVIYNTTTGDIKVAKGSTSQAVALVVQGNDGTNDWYYSKQITGTEVVKLTAIEAETNTPASIDLSTCKIWLETTDSTKNLTYAVEGTKTTIKIIHSVAITGIETPAANTTLDTGASCVTEGVSSNTPQITWTPSDSTAGYNTSYTASITLTAATGYEFIGSTTATVSGNDATSVNKNADGTLTVTYAFPATAKDKLTSITTPQAITVANGTAYSAMNLPEQVNIVTEGNTVSSAPVTWNTTTPASGSYDPSVLTEQTVTLNGTVACPATIDTNGVSTIITITITISAADSSDSAPDNSTPDNSTPDNGTPDNSTPDNGTPDNGTPDNGTPAKEMGLTGGDWKLDNGKWWYAAEDGSYPANGWTKIEGEWYAFDAAGYMETGWYQSGNDWYYLGSSGAMETGWVLDGNTWYYMNESGAMKTGWVLDGNTWYYMNESGAMKTGWVWDGANWYYMNASGAMQTGWIWDGANWYYMYANGVMAHDVVIGGYRLSASGAWVQ